MRGVRKRPAFGDQTLTIAPMSAADTKQTLYDGDTNSVGAAKLGMRFQGGSDEKIQLLLTAQRLTAHLCRVRPCGAWQVLPCGS
jgi:hypothetical protein